MKCVIPCEFTVTGKDYDIYQIQCGDQNSNEEIFQPGKSVTQTVQSYFFDIIVKGKSRKLHIIDTPAVSDTAGVIKDIENLQKIVDFFKQNEGLKQYGCLHAICILARPNDSRLTLSFRYCLREILALLSRGRTFSTLIHQVHFNLEGFNFAFQKLYPIFAFSTQTLEALFSTRRGISSSARTNKRDRT